MSKMIGNFETVRVASAATNGMIIAQGSGPRHALAQIAY